MARDAWGNEIPDQPKTQSGQQRDTWGNPISNQPTQSNPNFNPYQGFVGTPNNYRGNISMNTNFIQQQQANQKLFGTTGTPNYLGKQYGFSQKDESSLFGTTGLSLGGVGRSISSTIKFPQRQQGSQRGVSEIPMPQMPSQTGGQQVNTGSNFMNEGFSMAQPQFFSPRSSSTLRRMG